MYLAEPLQPVAPVAAQDHERSIPPEPVPPKPPEVYKLEEPHIFEKPSFFPAKPIPFTPIISPSSIPIPNPSVTITKHAEPGYPNYGGFLSSTPGYSAFQPVITGYRHGLVPQSQPPSSEPPNSDFLPFSPPNIVRSTHEPMIEEESTDTDALLMVTDDEETQQTPDRQQQENQTDFEEHFTPEKISTIPAVPSVEVLKPAESKMSITSLAQGSGATIIIPSTPNNNEVKKKPERFSLMTSIPISKIDMKCVNNAPDPLYQTSISKKTFNTPTTDVPKIAIQSNIIIKPATKEPEDKETMKSVAVMPNNNIGTLINAAEAINKTENLFRVPEVPKIDFLTETKKTTLLPKPLFNPMNIETSKANFMKPSERESCSGDAKSQILLIQSNNNNNQTPKMLVAIQQQNPQVLLQRTNLDPKNLQAPSRLSNESKKGKEDTMNYNPSSKVYSLKRLHQENSDENDFENLITENQIYGNKIVVKEKSQGTLHEQDLNKKKLITEKVTTTEAKSVVLQPNYLYLSNVQFPNMMIVKNSVKINQNTDSDKTKILLNENKIIKETNTIAPDTDVNVVSALNKTMKQTPQILNKEIHVQKSNNDVLQILPNNVKPDLPKPDTVTKSNNIIIGKPDIIISKSERVNIKSDLTKTTSDRLLTKPDITIQGNQKVIINSQLIYQVPMSSKAEGEKITQPKIMNNNSREYPTFTQKDKYSKTFVKRKMIEKINIACPNQIDFKVQPKPIVVNQRSTLNKADELSSIEIYEKRRRLRRLKYLTHRDLTVNKDLKLEASNDPTSVIPSAKKIDKNEVCNANVITPDKINNEIYKEFASTKGTTEDGNSVSDSDDGDEIESKLYESIIEEYSTKSKTPENEEKKRDFLINLRLASAEAYREIELDLQERMLKHDKVRSAYAAVGRLDLIMDVDGVGVQEETTPQMPVPTRISTQMVRQENLTRIRKKTMFLSKLKLTQTTKIYKEEYEKAWEVIVNERHRRNGTADRVTKHIVSPPFCLDTKGQLEMLTEIKQCVNENNNLIKKMLDKEHEKQTNEESISVLAEKNFSELTRLSDMADRSVKLVSGQNTGKRDLNPGFDSENIQKQDPIIEQPVRAVQNYHNLNIPIINKIITPKSDESQNSVTTQAASSQATSMDEPRGSAAGLTEIIVTIKPYPCQTADACCQVEECDWPDVARIIKRYKQFETDRRREILELHRRNTKLRVDNAHITRAASRDSDRARALLAERQNLMFEENKLRLSLQRLRNAIDVIKKYNVPYSFR